MTQPPRRIKTGTPAEIHAEAVKTARGLKAEVLRKGKGPTTVEYAVADRLLKAIQSLPAYELAEAAVLETGQTGFPAAVIWRLARQAAGEAHGRRGARRQTADGRRSR